MAINANVLSFVAGAAEQFTKTKDELKKELRENKRRQRDWMNTYGSKVLTESKQKEEAVTSALKELESRGLAQPDVLQLMQRHGVDAVLELQKYVKDYEDTSGTRVDKDLINKVWKAADDFTLTSDNYGDAVSKVFGTNKVASAAPVIQEAEDRNFFDILKRNLSGDPEDEELQDFLTDATEGIGGKSINELRRMAAASPSMLGTAGAAVFDRSALRGSEPSAGEARLWKDTVPVIVREALKNLSPEDRRAVEMTEAETDSGLKVRDADDIFFDLSDPDGVYFDAFSEATRKVHEQNPFSNNRSATGAYGGQDALNAILNPLIALKEQLAENGLSDEDSQLIVDNPFVKTGNEQEDLAKVREFLEANPNLPYVIIDNKIMEAEGFLNMTEEGGGDEEGSTDTPPPTEGIPTRPVPRYTGGEKTRPLQKPINHRDIKDWDKQYGDRYNPDATPIIVEPRPVLPETFDETVFDTPKKIREERGRINNEIIKWNRQYKKTHDPETGNPLPFGSE